MKKEKLYFSFDIEADGPTPMKNSLLSIGIVVFQHQNSKIEEIDKFEMNIRKRDEGEEDHSTIEWWKTQPDAWNYCQTNTISPKEAMEKLSNFFSSYLLKGFKICWIAGPACFDWMFLKSYYETFGPKNKPDIGHNCCCLSEAKRGFIRQHTIEKYQEYEKLWTTCDYENSSDIKKEALHTHRAIDDALRQGRIYMGILFDKRPYL